MKKENIKTRTTELLHAMCKGAYEREEAIGLALLSAIAGESIFLLGLPGVGKSMIARRLKLAFKDSKSFEYLMSRFSTPDEIFGPVSISKLKDADTYERVVDGYLPTADIVFLDEIWKAGPAIQNSLLTALNEKIFHNGKNDIKIPLKAVISASNELPSEGEGLEALWDRFLVRYIVKPIDSKNKFLDLMFGKEEECSVSAKLQLDDKEIADLQSQAETVDVPEDVSELIYSIRKSLVNMATESDKVNLHKDIMIEPPYVSDRRWKKIAGILRMSALLNGRDSIDFSDCLLLEHMVWDRDDQLHMVNQLIAEKIALFLHENTSVPSIANQLEGNIFTEPVGELSSPDGEHYVFKAGTEDIMIKKQDYLDLATKKLSYGILTDDNKLVISREPTTLTVRITKPGTISLNTFIYNLQRTSNLRTGSVKSMMKNITTEMDVLEKAIRMLVENNIFLRDFNDYPEIHNAFNGLGDRIKRKGY